MHLMFRELKQTRFVRLITNKKFWFYHIVLNPISRGLYCFWLYIFVIAITRNRLLGSQDKQKKIVLPNIKELFTIADGIHYYLLLAKLLVSGCESLQNGVNKYLPPIPVKKIK